MTRPSWDQYFMSIAHTVATRSPCVKRQVGAVLVSEDKALLATGYNGPPRGAPHRDDKTCVRIGIPSGTQADVVCCAHAESNAIAQAARHGVPVKGSTLYVTTSPCAWCARGIINAGVVRVVREGAYNDPIAAGVFAESGVPVEELPAVPVSPELQKLAACMSLPAGSGMAEISADIQRLQTRTRAIDEVEEREILERNIDSIKSSLEEIEHHTSDLDGTVFTVQSSKGATTRAAITLRESNRIRETLGKIWGNSAWYNKPDTEDSA